MFDFFFPVAAEVVEAEAVLGEVGEGKQARLEQGPFRWIGLDLKNGVLDALAHILAGFCHVTQAFLSRNVSGGYIIGDENVHGGWGYFQRNGG